MEKMKNQVLKSNRTNISGEQVLQTKTELDDNVGLLEHNQISGEVMHHFPTGHKIQVDLDGQSLEVHDIHGQLQVHIDITSDGPKVKVCGGQLDLQSPENISMDCNSFRLTTAKDTEIFARGQVKIDSRDEMRITCEDEVFIRAKIIWLN
jgi:hypothetical protein